MDARRRLLRITAVGRRTSSAALPLLLPLPRRHTPHKLRAQTCQHLKRGRGCWGGRRRPAGARQRARQLPRNCLAFTA